MSHFLQPVIALAATLMMTLALSLTSLTALATTTNPPTSAGPFDWSTFDALLKAHVQPGNVNNIEANLVDYRTLKKRPEFFAIADQLAQYNPSGLDRAHTLAFYINAYNYFALKLVVDHYPLDSIKDLGNFLFPVWKKEAGKINGKTVSLDEIEHKVLRKLDEPGIHFAIVCASLSCPDLRREAYQADALKAQLADQVKRFLTQSKGKQVRHSNGESVLYLSNIFKWFEGDFVSHGGVIRYLTPHDPSLVPYQSFKTLDYNWQLNDLALMTTK